MKVGARYYAPAVGAFLTRDTDLSQPAYAYCDGDPVNFSDPSGHTANTNIWGGIGQAIGLAIGLAFAIVLFPLLELVLRVLSSYP